MTQAATKKAQTQQERRRELYHMRPSGVQAIYKRLTGRDATLSLAPLIDAVIRLEADEALKAEKPKKVRQINAPMLDGQPSSKVVVPAEEWHRIERIQRGDKPRYQAVHDAVQEVMRECEDNRDVADVLRSIAMPFRDTGEALRRVSWGGDGDYLTYKTVADALDKMATDVDENGQVTQ